MCSTVVRMVEATEVEMDGNGGISNDKGAGNKSEGGGKDDGYRGYDNGDGGGNEKAIVKQWR